MGYVLPPGSQITSICRQVVDTWHEAEPLLDWGVASANPPIDSETPEYAVQHLALINCFQWHLEDDCRLCYDDPLRLAWLKQAIDQSNQRRVAKIDDLDRLTFARLRRLRSEPADAPPTLVTPGSLVDRLSILSLKKFHVGERRPAEPAVLNLLDEQLDDLCQGFDRLLADLSAGRLRLKFYSTLKLYSAKDGG
jgi:hypothetical protein